MAGEVRMGQRIALGGAVAAPVGQVLQDRGNRPLAGVFRQPDPGREPNAVRQLDEHRVQHLDLAWERVDDLHDSLPVHWVPPGPEQCGPETGHSARNRRRTDGPGRTIEVAA